MHTRTNAQATAYVEQLATPDYVHRLTGTTYNAPEPAARVPVERHIPDREQTHRGPDHSAG